MISICRTLAAGTFFLALAAPFSVWGQSPLTWQERVRAQEAVERVNYSHRIWPKENKTPKPPFEQMVPRAVIEAKVDGYLRMSKALEDYWQRPITAGQLQAEMDRMARDTKDPAMLGELFAALNHDPALIAECLARPALAGRSIRQFFATDGRIHAQPRERGQALARSLELGLPEPAEGDVQRITFVASGEDREDSALPDGAPRPTLRVALSESEFARRKAQMPATGELPVVRESADRVTVLRTLESTPDSLDVEYRIFPKDSFESWWACASESFPATLPASYPRGTFLLPSPATLPACVDTWRALPENTPTARSSHTMVWTGAEVIVWGGLDGDYRTNTGARYSPATDTWFSTSTVPPCPSARDSHSAVWTGTEMVIWGGNEGTKYAQDGGRYNPLTDAWTAVSTSVGCPAARMSHTAVWTGSTMIIWGGYSGYNLNSGGIFTPSTDTWAITPAQAETPYARWGHAAVWTGTEMLIWGGYLGNGLFANSGSIFNPGAGSWRVMAAGEGSPSPRREMACVWTGTEMVVWGGYNGACLGTGGRYNPLTNTWQPVAMEGAPSARSAYNGAVWTGSQMLVWGGFCSFNIFGDGARYAPATDSWKVIAASSAPPARKGHQAIWTGEEMILWGGNDGLVSLDSGGRYSPASDTWVPTPKDSGSPSARDRHTAVWTGAELVVWGGFVIDATGWSELSTGGSYSPATDNWTATSEGAGCPTGRYAHSAVWTGTEMIVWAGHRYANGADLDVNSGGRYIPSSATWSPTATLFAAAQRNSHTAIWTGESMVVWGGYQMGGGYPHPINEGGRYFPGTDTWLATSHGANCPSARVAQGVWTGSELLIWGGGTLDTQYGDGALYDPLLDMWRPIPSDPQTPSARMSSWNVWTGDELVIWGGKGSNDPDGVYRRSGGIWNPSTGVWRASSTGDGCPVGRYFDIGVAPWSGVELLVWGGANGLDYLDTGGRYNPRTDTWWPTATSLAPTARFRHTTTWCGSNLVVFGGLGPTNYERSGAAYTVRPQSFSCSASATPAAGSVPLEVAFEAAAVPEGCDGVSTFAWSFGDGGTSGLSNPTHVYQSPGTFGWTVTASTNGSLCSSQGTVVVTPPCALDCTAEVLPVTGVAPLTVHCAATAPSAHCDGAPAFAWSFGDGGTSQEQNPGHTYAEAGTYGWTLVVNQGGQTCTKTGSVTAIAPCTLDCAASATPASGTAPLAVVFAADAAPSGCAGSPAFSWNFGDGESSSQQDPSHSYSSPGAYTWTLAVSQDGKVCERTGTVTVSAPCTLSCSAGAAPTSGTAPLDVAFTALWASNGCAGDPAFAWDFGDGGSSAEQNPSHRYTVAGARTWTLTVTQAGSTCSKTGDIEVRAGIPGDCDGDGQVSIGEVQKAINMFLGILPVGCGVDCNGDGSVSIGEVQKVINAFLGLTVSC